MQLTDFTDHALRVLMFLAARPDRLATIREITDAYGVSGHHMVKVVHRLGKLGYLETIRGNGGGIRLARPAAAIVIGAVVRDTEENLTLVQCFSGGDRDSCRIEPACVLKGALAKALRAFLAELDRWTLADLVGPHKAALAGLLAGAAGSGAGSGAGPLTSTGDRE